MKTNLRIRKTNRKAVKKYQQTEKGKQTKNKADKKYQQVHRIELNEKYRAYQKTIKGCLCYRFKQIKQRCNNLKNPAYKNYGGRGIKCLFKSSQEFVDYVINELKIDPRKLCIDRISNNGHYEKGNIRFVTHKVNNNNKRER